jgi:two-component system, cell cycle sensor histidine kinase and response regulator CckA
MRRVSAGLKVGLAFGCLIVLLIGVGWLGLNRMGQISASTNRIFAERWEKLYTARQAESYFNAKNRAINRFFLTEDAGKEEIALFAAQMNENNAKGSAVLKQIEAGPVSDAEKEILGQIKEAKAPADKSVDKMMDLLVNQGKIAEANKLNSTETLLLLSKYHDTWVAFTDYERNQVNQAGVQSKASYAAVRRLSATLILLAIVFAISIAVFVTRTLEGEVRERERAQTALRDANEGLERKVSERTEELARTVEVLRQEVNERTKQEVDLRRLAAIVESSDDVILAASLDGMVTNWNPGAERIMGFQQSEIIGQHISLVIPPGRFGEVERIVQRLIAGEQVVREETVRLRKDGKRIHVSLTVSPMRGADGEMIGTTAIYRDITERKKVEEALRRSEAAFRSMVENAPYGILRTKPDGRIVQANPSMVRMLGYSSEQEVLNLNMTADVYFNPEDRESALVWSRQQDSIRGNELEWKRKNKSAFAVSCNTHIVRDKEGYLESLETFVEDITERRELELQLRQRQKMEAIGRLAGGIAHDFNNLLGVIIGYAELALEEIAPDGEVRPHVEQIQKAADRASALTGQLLAFSRQQVLETKTLNLNAIVEDMVKMLPPLLGEDVELDCSLDPALGVLRADRGQIEQVIMNLAVNARDAMPGGGKLVVRTENAVFDSDLASRHPAMNPGNYILLTVSDTGTGMDEQTMARIFEPFFTTKERGRGTGLGLATVYGFMKQIGGYVWVESKPEVGSTFTIYFPMTGEAVSPEDLEAESPAHAAGTILLVEDEESLRTLTRSILECGGYHVLEASNGLEAIEIAKGYSGKIHLLLTDMVMPGMNGRAVAEKMEQMYPGIKIAYMSGYVGFATREAATLKAIVIAKPFTRNQLLQKLGEALESGLKPV